MCEEPPASSILGNFHYSALDLHSTSLQFYISLSVVLFLMDNPQNIFSLLSSRHLALFHPSQVLSAGSRDWESCSVTGLSPGHAAAPSWTALRGKELPHGKGLRMDMGSGTINTPSLPSAELLCTLLPAPGVNAGHWRNAASCLVFPEQT